MNFTVIYTTKTNARIASITAGLAAKTVRSDPFAACYVFCEDKNTLSLETEIARATGGSFNVVVTSFSRYLSSRGGAAQLSKSGSALAVYNVMSELGGELKRLRLGGRPSLASVVFELISQLKSAKATPEKLLEICRREPDGAFGSKLLDLYKIYAAYEAYLTRAGRFDSAGAFDLVPPLIVSDEKLKGAKVIFSGFATVTRQILDVFSAAAGVADCDFVLLRGEGQLYTNEVFTKVCELFPAAETVRDDFAFLPEAEEIGKKLFSPQKIAPDASGCPPKKMKTDRVIVFETDSPYREAELVARQIRREVVENGRRFKDFAVACADPAAYGSIFADAFAECGVPILVDEPESLSAHPMTRLVTKILDVAASGCGVSEMLALSKERLFAEPREAAAFEKYVYSHAVRRRAFASPFSGDDEYSVLAEKVRARALDICRDIKAASTTEQFTEAIKRAFVSLGAEERLDEMNERLESLGESAMKETSAIGVRRVASVLDEISALIGDKKVSPKEYKAIFSAACEAVKFSILPLYNDAVYMGEFKSVKQRQTSILFAVGLTSDVPGVKQDTALLTDRDLVRMESYRCVVEPKIRVVNLRERECFGVALTSFSERLYCTYPTRDQSGQRTSKSEAITYLSKIFDFSDPDNRRKRDEFSECGVYDFLTLEAGKRRFYFSVGATREGKTGAEKLNASFYEAAKERGTILPVEAEEKTEKLSSPVSEKLSASLIEKFFSCPFVAFAENNLRLKTEENGQAQPFEMGNLLHAFMQSFVAQVEKIESSEKAEKIAGELFDKILENAEYSRYTATKRYERLFGLVKNEAVRRAKEIYEEFGNSSFVPAGFEVGFGNVDGAIMPAIEIETSLGKRRLSGKIDRLDRYGKFVRVIDYKTGSTEDKIKEESLYTGRSVQLYLYAGALPKEDELVGIYYYKLDDTFGDGSERRRFYGKTVLDGDLFVATDHRLATENDSAKYNIGYEDKGGDRIPKQGSGALTKEDFDGFVKYAGLVATAGANELNSGFIEPTPYGDKCKYCPYGGMCGYDAETDYRTRKLTRVTKDDVIGAATGEKNE